MNRLFLSSISILRSGTVFPKSVLKFRVNGLPRIHRSFCASAQADTTGSAESNSEDQKKNEVSQDNSPHSRRENITDRLIRLSIESPEDFVPTLSPEESEERRWEKYSKAGFPDQRLRRNSMPDRRGSFSDSRNDRSRYPGGSSFQRDDYTPRNSNYSRRPRGINGEDDEEAEFNNLITSPTGQMDTRRYNGRFESDYVPQRPQPKSQRPRAGRINSFGDVEEHKPLDYKKMMNDYDLDESDLPEPQEPRQSSRIRFANNENREAIKEAYMKRFKTKGSDELTKRNFHSIAYHTALESSLRNPRAHKDFGDLSRGAEKRFPNNIGNIPKENKIEGSMPERVTTDVDDDDSDLFGNLAAAPVDSVSDKYDLSTTSVIPGESIYDKEEEDDTTFRPEITMSMMKLKFSIQNLLKEKKLTEAMDLFTTTLKEGGLRYQKSQLEYVYRIIIAECAKAGNTKMAFKLHIQMRKRGLWIKPSVYTSLFNACSNAPEIASENLIKMGYLRDQMGRKGYLPNLINYNAMIKAYGRCGDIETAYAIVDEMIDRRDKLVRPNADTFCFLLQACISDKQNGFRNALFTWDKMKTMRIRPLIYSYNLLLRATRECGVKIPEDIQRQLDQRRADREALRAAVSDPTELELVKSLTAPTIDPGVVQGKLVASDALTTSSLARLQDCISLVMSDAFATRKNVEVVRKNQRTAVMLSDEAMDTVELLKLGHYRLLMLGGMRGVLKQMEADRIKPDLKTLQAILLLVRPHEVWDVVKLLDDYEVQHEVGFYNILIRKLALHGRREDVLLAVKDMSDRRITPDIFTWTAIAPSCRNWALAKQLIDDMETANFTFNTEVAGALVASATKFTDPMYLVEILDLCKKEQVPPTPDTLEHIEDFIVTVRQSILEFEKGIPVKNLSVKTKLTANPDDFLSEWKIFRGFYSKWIREVGVEVEPEDPWAEDFRRRFPPRQIKSEVE